MKNNLLVKGISIITVFALGFITASPVLAYTKDETVYGKLTNDGSNYSTIVNEHLKNANKTEILRDMSDLLNIKNINGEETFEAEGNILKWNSNGNDIYYQGNIQKEIPLDCTIKYELDGEEILAQDLVGKSGKVKITIDYINKDEHIVNINGKDTKMYTPFVVITGTILNNSKAKNITVTNGKVVDNGTKTLIAAITCPGLQESLDIDAENIEIPNKVELEFEAIDFEMGNIISYATPKLIEKSDFENIDKLDDLYSKISILDTSSSELVKGAKDIEQGVKTYVEKNTEFSEAINSLQEGTETVNDNYELLDNGVNQLHSSVVTLESGANKVNNGVYSVTDGLDKLQSGVYNGKQQATATLNESAQSLEDGIANLINGKDKEAETIKSEVIEAGNESLKQALTSSVSNGAKEIAGVTLNVILEDEQLQEQLGITFTEAQKQALVTALKTNIDTSTLERGINNAIDLATEEQKQGVDTINNNSKGVKAGLKALRNQSATSIKEGISSISAGFDIISSGVDTINEGAQNLKEGSTQLYQGTKKLTIGTSNLSKSSGLLKTGISTLNTSTIAINEANKQLLEGSKTIEDGVNTLAEGILKFDEEGIKQISNLVNGEVKDLQERIEALKNLANNYNNFAGIDEDIEGTVKFVLMTDSIKK